MLFSILTLFPDAVEAYLDVGVLGVARARGKVAVRVIDFRDFARDRHRTVDDRPFGGGPGMVLTPGPIVEAVEWVERRHGRHRRIALTPDGTPFSQGLAQSFVDAARPSSEDGTQQNGTRQNGTQQDGTQQNGTPVLLLCGRYEGFDERALALLEFERLSIGDYVLAGGELAALVVVESVARLVPGVLGDERSAVEDSFTDANDGALDHPHFTRPRVFRGAEVPEVLMSGDHARIAAWRREQSDRRTRTVRPELARP